MGFCQRVGKGNSRFLNYCPSCDKVQNQYESLTSCCLRFKSTNSKSKHRVLVVNVLMGGPWRGFEKAFSGVTLGAYARPTQIGPLSPYWNLLTHDDNHS